MSENLAIGKVNFLRALKLVNQKGTCVDYQDNDKSCLTCEINPLVNKEVPDCSMETAFRRAKEYLKEQIG